LGHEGVLAWLGSNFHYAPAFHVQPLDTTGAGDIFHAGFIYGLLQDWPISANRTSPGSRRAQLHQLALVAASNRSRILNS
jgi:sugar/nucleoside kinase (ribokinase family)